MISDPPLEFLQLADVATQQIQHVLAGTHRTLDTAQRIAAEQLLDALVRQQQLVCRVAKRFPSVVTCAGTLWVRPIIGWSAYWVANWASCTRAPPSGLG